MLIAATVLTLLKPRDSLGFGYLHPVDVIAPGWLNPGGMGTSASARGRKMRMEIGDPVGYESASRDVSLNADDIRRMLNEFKLIRLTVIYLTVCPLTSR